MACALNDEKNDKIQHAKKETDPTAELLVKARKMSNHTFKLGPDPETNHTRIQGRLRALREWAKKDPLMGDVIKKSLKEGAAALRANRPALSEYRRREEEKAPKVSSGYWLNTKTGIRHTILCEHAQNSQEGRWCTYEEGKACKKCGGW